MARWFPFCSHRTEAFVLLLFSFKTRHFFKLNYLVLKMFGIILIWLVFNKFALFGGGDPAQRGEVERKRVVQYLHVVDQL